MAKKSGQEAANRARSGGANRKSGVKKGVDAGTLLRAGSAFASGGKSVVAEKLLQTGSAIVNHYKTRGTRPGPAEQAHNKTMSKVARNNPGTQTVGKTTSNSGYGRNPARGDASSRVQPNKFPYSLVATPVLVPSKTKKNTYTYGKVVTYASGSARNESGAWGPAKVDSRLHISKTYAGGQRTDSPSLEEYRRMTKPSKVKRASGGGSAKKK